MSDDATIWSNRVTPGHFPFSGIKQALDATVMSSTIKCFLLSSDKSPPRRALRIADSKLRRAITPSVFKSRHNLFSLWGSNIVNFIYYALLCPLEAGNGLNKLPHFRNFQFDCISAPSCG